MLISHLLLKLAILSSSFFLSASAFGAGTIAALSAIKGINFRHGDIEETLLSLAIARCVSGLESAPSSSGGGGAGADALFTDLETKRVYFGNWLRDYSQAIDVGALKYVGADAMRMLIWLLGFLAFGRGTDGFEVTRERLGCYQPTEHIDNPRGYANGEDARAYDPRLRPPVNEEVELAIDGRTGALTWNVLLGVSDPVRLELKLVVFIVFVSRMHMLMLMLTCKLYRAQKLHIYRRRWDPKFGHYAARYTHPEHRPRAAICHYQKTIRPERSASTSWLRPTCPRRLRRALELRGALADRTW